MQTEVVLQVREKEAADFAAAEAELVDSIDTLGRAINIIQREMQKNPAALAQISTDSLSGLLQGISAVVDAASFPASALHAKSWGVPETLYIKAALAPFGNH